MAERESLIRSLEIMHEYQWMLLRHLFLSVGTRFGEPGVLVLRRGLRRFGEYRGSGIADSPGSIAAGRDALSLIHNWDISDFTLAGAVEIEGRHAEASVRLPGVPGGEYFAAKGSRRALELYWADVPAGLAMGYDDRAAVAVADVSERPWSMTWSFDTGNAAKEASQTHTLEDVFADAAKYLRMARRTTGIVAALQMFVGRELLRDFDASGEEALREACFAYGAERGLALRERHQAHGIPLNLESMVEKLAEDRDPLSAIFVVRGESYVSAGLPSEVDCTYCPLAEVWAEQGKEGLELGYIFDMELHRGLVETLPRRDR
jgi:hypothetical protein